MWKKNKKIGFFFQGKFFTEVDEKISNSHQSIERKDDEFGTDTMNVSPKLQKETNAKMMVTWENEICKDPQSHEILLKIITLCWNVCTFRIYQKIWRELVVQFVIADMQKKLFWS